MMKYPPPMRMGTPMRSGTTNTGMVSSFACGAAITPRSQSGFGNPERLQGDYFGCLCFLSGTVAFAAPPALLPDAADAAGAADAALLPGERGSQRQTERGKGREIEGRKKEREGERVSYYNLSLDHDSSLVAAGATSRSLRRGPAAWASRRSAASAASAASADGAAVAGDGRQYRSHASTSTTRKNSLA